MSSLLLTDLRAAKRELSARYLRAASPTPLAATFDLEAARIAAGAQIHALGIGRKRVEGKTTGTRCVRVHVLQKLSDTLIAEKDRVPPEIDGVPTDVVVSPRAFLFGSGPCVSRDIPQRPLRGGIGISGPRTTAGTLGCFVVPRKGDPTPFLLTCSHVIADQGATRGDPVVQPALADVRTSPTATVAKLDRFTRVLSEAELEVDAALAELLDPENFEPEICGLVRPVGTRAPENGLGVQCRGRSTPVGSPAAVGRISDRDLDITIQVPHGREILYRDQFRVEPISPSKSFSEGGDSGALILEEGGPRAVGLLVGGDPGGSYSIATPIRRVLDHFEVSMV